MENKKDDIQSMLNNSSVKPKQKYKHFKGGEYEVVTLAMKEDTLEPLVIYRSIAKGFIWARTVENFTEEIIRDGQKIKRFTLITD